MNEHKLALADDPSLDMLDAMADDKPWSIKDDKALVWAMEPLALAEEERKRDQAMYDAAKAKLDAWLASRLESIESGTAYLRAEITRYCTENRERLVHGKTKQVSLPSGTVQWRKTSALIVTDLDALTKWAVEEGPTAALYRVSTAPELTKITQLVRATGVLPPGTDWKEVESITIKPSQPLLPKET